MTANDKSEMVVFSDKAAACLDAADQVGELREAATDTIGIRRAFKRYAILICEMVPIGFGSSVLASFLGKGFDPIKGVLFGLGFGAFFGLYLLYHVYKIDNRYFNNVTLLAYASLMDTSKAETLKMIKENDPRFVAALDKFLVSEPYTYLQNSKSIVAYEKNLKILSDFRSEPSRESVKLTNGTQVLRSGFVL